MTSQLLSAQQTQLTLALRDRLEALLKEVGQDLITADDDRAALLSDRVRDVGDESLADLIVDLDLADTDRDLEELRGVEAALSRVKLGTYGMCVDCGGPIPFDRLQAQITASRCEPCQQYYERSFAQKGKPSL